MTPQEIKNEIDAIASELGKKAYVSLHIGSGPVWNNDGALSLTAYPQGIGSDKHRISVNAHAFEDAILLVRASIGESVAKINADTIRKPAIAITTLVWPAATTPIFLVAIAPLPVSTPVTAPDASRVIALTSQFSMMSTPSAEAARA